jgi:hypothetical protein
MSGRRMTTGACSAKYHLHDEQGAQELDQEPVPTMSA